MDAAEIIQLIERGAERFFRGLVQEVRSNLGTTYYRRLSNAEVARRMTVVYEGLESWLKVRDAAAVRKAGEELGKLRFSESIPLGQVVLSLVLEEKYFCKYFADQNKPLDGEWPDVISEYFQRLIYSAAQGYETALAYSNRLASGNVPAEHHPHAEPPQPSQDDLEVSRAGEIGEVSG